MAKERSYIELPDLPLDRLNDGLSLPMVLTATKYGPIAEPEKPEVVILKEAFVLVDPKAKRVGVFTRSDRDHGTKIGQCSTLLCGNFDRNECTVTKDGAIIYDVKDRLHNYVREISGLFVEAPRASILGVFFHDKERKKRYLLLLFELTCDSRALPLCYRLDNRAEDMFIGMRDVDDVRRGVERYNRTPFEIDRAIVHVLTKRFRWFSGNLSIAEKIVDAKLASFTLIRVNLIGI